MVVRDRKSILKRYDTSTVAMSEEGHKKKWSVDCVGPLTVWNGRVITSSNYRRRPERIEIRDAVTGKVEQKIDAPIGMHPPLLRDILLEHSFEKDHHLVRAVSLTKARVLWEYVAPEGVRIDAPFAAKDDRVVVAQDDGAVIAFSLATGEEIWRHSLADLSLKLPSGTRPGSADGLLAIWDDKVVMTVSATHVLALSLGDGSRCWDWKSKSAGLFRAGYLYDGRYYTLDSLGGYAVVDAATGKLS